MSTEQLTDAQKAILADGKPTDYQKCILAMVELNRATPPRDFVRKWSIGRWQITFEWRSKKNLWGRFGGGWNWELGFQIGGSTVLIMLLVASLRITRRTAK